MVAELLISATLSAGIDVDGLERENARLRSLVDSLQRVVELRKDGFEGDVLDTWGDLDGIWDDGLTDLAAEHSGLDNAEDSEIYNDILANMPCLRIPWHNDLKKYIHYYTSGSHRKRMPVVIGRYRRYLPEFRTVFQQFGIPEELIPLCIVESAVSPRAKSRVGALGMWQFMPETARGYGLRVDAVIDERMEHYKSTVAAAKYLKNAYKSFGRWDLAILSYNCGAARITKAQIRSGNSRDLWEIAKYLPEETRGYLPSLVAASYVLRHCEELGIGVKEMRQDAFSAVLLNRDATLTEISAAGHVGLKTLRDANPQVLTDYVPAGSVIMVPGWAFKSIKSLF